MRSIYVSPLRTASFACIVAAGTLLSAVRAMAQMQVVQVTVPFAFQSGSQKMPAGIYRIDLTSQHVLTLRGADAHHSGNLLTMSEIRLHPPTKGVVIFHRYGSRYFLSEVWQAGNPVGSRVVKGREEKEAQLALVSSPTSNVELALNQPGK